MDMLALISDVLFTKDFIEGYRFIYWVIYRADVSTKRVISVQDGKRDEII